MTASRMRWWWWWQARKKQNAALHLLEAFHISQKTFGESAWAQLAPVLWCRRVWPELWGFTEWSKSWPILPGSKVGCMGIYQGQVVYTVFIYIHRVYSIIHIAYIATDIYTYRYTASRLVEDEYFCCHVDMNLGKPGRCMATGITGKKNTYDLIGQSR